MQLRTIPQAVQVAQLRREAAEQAIAVLDGLGANLPIDSLTVYMTGIDPVAFFGTLGPKLEPIDVYQLRRLKEGETNGVYFDLVVVQAGDFETHTVCTLAVNFSEAVIYPGTNEGQVRMRTPVIRDYVIRCIEQATDLHDPPPLRTTDLNVAPPVPVEVKPDLF